MNCFITIIFFSFNLSYNIRFNFNNSNGWQVSVDGKTFNATDIQELGISFGKNDQGQTTVSIPGYKDGQPIQVANVSNNSDTTAFINNFKKGDEIL